VWSVIAPLPETAPGIESIHAAMLDPLCAALTAAGRPVIRRGSSDIAIDVGGTERKVSGNALRIRRGAVLYHGTLLDRFDIDLIARVLRHPPREPGYRAQRTHEAFLANLRLGREPLESAVRRAFAAGDVCRDWPQDRVTTLVRDRYLDVAWTHRLP
jgi:lipoate-protein ligase A